MSRNTWSNTPPRKKPKTGNPIKLLMYTYPTIIGTRMTNPSIAVMSVSFWYPFNSCSNLILQYCLSLFFPKEMFNRVCNVK